MKPASGGIPASERGRWQAPFPGMAVPREVRVVFQILIGIVAAGDVRHHREHRDDASRYARR